MPRKRREEWSPDHFYHIVTRGNRRDPLFQDERDVKAFLSILTKVHEKTSFEIASFCLMNNHYHLHMRSSKTDMSSVMAMINRRYSSYYNTRYNLTGHAYEERFYSDKVPGVINNIHLSHYIHMNPLRANMVSDPAEYSWSSYQYFHNLALTYPTFFSPLHILNCYGGTLAEKQMKYLESLDHYNEKFLSKT
ncbi:transposase [Rossellomorea vietnamensis]|nr:transposase [Rossellomorea vietnamensis]